jgi:single-strand DNA-binding protein
MYDTNRVVLVGRLTRDPELRSLPSGRALCSLRIATNSPQREADGEYGERPNFFDVDVFGPPAEVVAEHMRRGRQVCVDGHLSWREWETPDEQKRQAVSIQADRVQFLGSPRERDGEEGLVGAGVGDGGEDAPF